MADFTLVGKNKNNEHEKHRTLTPNEANHLNNDPRFQEIRQSKFKKNRNGYNFNGTRGLTANAIIIANELAEAHPVRAPLPRITYVQIINLMSSLIRREAIIAFAPASANEAEIPEGVEQIVYVPPMLVANDEAIEDLELAEEEENEEQYANNEANNDADNLSLAPLSLGAGGGGGGGGAGAGAVALAPVIAVAPAQTLDALPREIVMFHNTDVYACTSGNDVSAKGFDKNFTFGHMLDLAIQHRSIIIVKNGNGKWYLKGQGKDPADAEARIQGNVGKPNNRGRSLWFIKY